MGTWASAQPEDWDLFFPLNFFFCVCLSLSFRTKNKYTSYNSFKPLPLSFFEAIKAIHSLEFPTVSSGQSLQSSSRHDHPYRQQVLSMLRAEYLPTPALLWLKKPEVSVFSLKFRRLEGWGQGLRSNGEEWAPCLSALPSESPLSSLVRKWPWIPTGKFLWSSLCSNVPSLFGHQLHWFTIQNICVWPHYIFNGLLSH